MQIASAFTKATNAIRTGTATPGQLWVILSGPHDRDGYALRPLQWEGSGEYQRVSYNDGRDGFVRVPDTGFLSLQDAVKRADQRARWTDKSKS